MTRGQKRMKYLGMILLLLFLTLALPQIATTGGDPYRIRAAQVFYTPSKDYKGFEEEIKKIKSQGINTVIFRVFGNKGDRIHGIAKRRSEIGVYYSTSHAPVIEDILGKVVEISHSQGIRLFAWMTTRDAIYGASEDMLDREFSIPAGKETTIPRLDLFNPKSLRYLEGLYLDLGRYPIDGVLFQDDLTIKQMEALGTSARLEFLLDLKRALDPKRMYREIELKPDGRIKRIVYTEEFWRWAMWKNKRLLEVAKDLTRILKGRNPRIKTALNATYELFRRPENTLAWQSHNTDLAKEFDYVALMTYQHQMMEELGANRSEVETLIKNITENAIREMGDPKRVIMKIQTINWGNREPIPEEEINATYRSIDSVSPEVGVAFVPWE